MRYWLCLFAALALLCLPAGAVELPKELTDALPSQAERLLEGETGDLLGGVSALWGNLRQEAGKILRSRLKTAAGVLFTVLLCGMLGGPPGWERRGAGLRPHGRSPGHRGADGVEP